MAGYKINNPYQATTPLGAAISNFGNSLHAGYKTPAEKAGAMADFLIDLTWLLAASLDCR